MNQQSEVNSEIFPFNTYIKQDAGVFNIHPKLLLDRLFWYQGLAGLNIQFYLIKNQNSIFFKLA